jgi:hypothetical protein
MAIADEMPWLSAEQKREAIVLHIFMYRYFNSVQSSVIEIISNYQYPLLSFQIS